MASLVHNQGVEFAPRQRPSRASVRFLLRAERMPAVPGLEARNRRKKHGETVGIAAGWTSALASSTKSEPQR
ncbi:hypothetical protein CCMA1212_005408 [Trichoderma ghanense]|uniref:Uncharacterized protein n=1 Tax=Trichoderma ghanense TaxID=65468 RepID=A0ABY2H384_9HYPO